MIERTTYTFGREHAGPDGEKLRDRHVEIVGPLTRARETMAKLFDNRWSAEYFESSDPDYVHPSWIYTEALALGTVVQLSHQPDGVLATVENIAWCDHLCNDPAPHAMYAFPDPDGKGLTWACNDSTGITLPADPLDEMPAVTTDQWAAVLAYVANDRQEDWSTYGAYALSPANLWDVLYYSRDVLADREPSDPLALRELADITIEDSSNGDAIDMRVIVTVRPTPGRPLRLASDPIRYNALGPETGCGPNTARAVLDQLVDERNRLVRDLRIALTAQKLA